MHLDVGDFCLSPAFFACLQDTYHPKGVVSGQSRGPYSSLSAPGPQLFPGCVVSCHLAPAPVSLLPSRDLPFWLDWLFPWCSLSSWTWGCRLRCPQRKSDSCSSLRFSLVLKRGGPNTFSDALINPPFHAGPPQSGVGWGEERLYKVPRPNPSRLPDPGLVYTLPLNNRELGTLGRFSTDDQ